MLCPVRPVAEMAAIPVFSGVVRGQYGRLCLRFYESSLCRFYEADARPVTWVQNEIFGVPKDADFDRVILDARRGNLCFNDPPAVSLVNPGVFGDLYLPKGMLLFVATSDADNMYHRLRLPDWLHPFFGLPPCWSTDVGLNGPRRLVYPAMTSCPMGFSWAVHIAQTIHERLLNPIPGHGPELRLGHDGPRVIGQVLHAEYIDDYTCLGTDASQVNKNLGAHVSASSAAGLPPKLSKLHPVSDIGPASAADSLGLRFFRDGTVRTIPDNTAGLLGATQVLLRLGACSGRRLHQIVGGWTWNALLRRPALSVFSACYDFIQQNERRVRRLPPPVRQELQAIMGLVPLLRVDLSAKIAPRMYATDASSWGAGVCYTTIPGEIDIESILKAGRTPVGDAALLAQSAPSVHWNTAVSAPWHHQQHINMLEGHAILLGLRHATRVRALWGSRVPFLVDSSVMVGALRKGRSSSPGINSVCRRAAAVQLATNIRPIWVWCPTAINPADAPSRYRHG